MTIISAWIYPTKVDLDLPRLIPLSLGNWICTGHGGRSRLYWQFSCTLSPYSAGGFLWLTASEPCQQTKEMLRTSFLKLKYSIFIKKVSTLKQQISQIKQHRLMGGDWTRFQLTLSRGEVNILRQTTTNIHPGERHRVTTSPNLNTAGLQFRILTLV